jgi:predicted NAD/FAD-binding protein
LAHRRRRQPKLRRGAARVAERGAAPRRTVDGVELRTDDGALRRYDHAVVATHADQALALLADPSPEEQRTLARFEYSENEAVLHTCSSLLPRAHAARASWNYLLGADGEPTITYWLNSLQRLEADEDYCVTLNAPVPEAAVIGRYRYSHPLFTSDTLGAQRALRALSGQRHTSYAGAHLGNGFHEAGLSSGVAAASTLGGSW